MEIFQPFEKQRIMPVVKNIYLRDPVPIQVGKYWQILVCEGLAFENLLIQEIS
jgi:hypothetical protein